MCFLFESVGKHLFYSVVDSLVEYCSWSVEYDLYDFEVSLFWLVGSKSGVRYSCGDRYFESVYESLCVLQVNLLVVGGV